MKWINTVFIVLLAQMSCLVFAAENTEPQTAEPLWELKRDRDNVQVYTRNVPGSPYDEVRSITVVNDIRMSSMIALLMHSEACPQWADKCAESYVHEKISDTELLIYTHNNLPFPVKDRDILSRVLWSQNPITLEATMTSEATQGILAEQKGRLRLLEASVSWNFRPLDSGAIAVSNEAHVNPGSTLPGWLINILLVDTPFKTMKAFRETAAQPQYENAVLSFIKEPGE